MEVICGKLSGFCAGVRYTVSKAEELVRDNKGIYCLGEIVHNERVVKKLEYMGMITKESIDDIPKNSKAIIRAHGESKETYEKAEAKNIKVFDLTCGKIIVIKKKIEKEVDKAFIIVIGKKAHPETIGTLSFCGKYCFAIENEEDIEEAYLEFRKSGFKRVYIIAQTTFSDKRFDLLTDKIKQLFKDAEVIVDKTICDATQKRQQETLELSKKVNKMVIIGGKHSSNTRELFKIAEENCKETFLVQGVEDLKDKSFSKDDVVGIMAGASTPQEAIDEIIEYLKNQKT